jgi:hypothetical protein
MKREEGRHHCYEHPTLRAPSSNEFLASRAPELGLSLGRRSAVPAICLKYKYLVYKG